MNLQWLLFIRYVSTFSITKGKKSFVSKPPAHREARSFLIFLFYFCTHWLYNGLLNSLSKDRHVYPTDTNSELAKKAMEVRQSFLTLTKEQMTYMIPEMSGIRQLTYNCIQLYAYHKHNQALAVLNQTTLKS